MSFLKTVKKTIQGGTPGERKRTKHVHQGSQAEAMEGRLKTSGNRDSKGANKEGNGETASRQNTAKKCRRGGMSRMAHKNPGSGGRMGF